MKFEAEKKLLPAFPRTPHLPYSPNAASDDIVAASDEAAVIFNQPINIEEKIDGASVGMTLLDGHPLIRNRDHILNKGYVKDTAAKKQFASIWNWFYEHKGWFEALVEAGPYSVYGEWCVAQHGLFYNELPDWFIAYDVYNHEQDKFLAPPLARSLLSEIGFALPKLLHQGQFQGSYIELAAWSNETAAWASDQRVEGVYLKVYDAKFVTQRFKLVRSDFVRGALWSPDQLTKNKLAGKS